MTESHSIIYGLSSGHVKNRRLPIVVSVTVAKVTTVTRENRDQGSIFRHETRKFCEAAAVLYYYN